MEDETNIPKPIVVDVQALAQWKKDTAEVERIILEGVRDHIVSNLHGKETPFSMWKTLIELFENNSDARKLALKDKLRNIYMQKVQTIPNYLSSFTQCRNELGGVGEIVASSELVNLALLGLPRSWNSYQDFVNGMDILVDWERFWEGLVQEEIQRNTVDGVTSKVEEEENFVLVGKGKIGKGKKS